jgi:phosphatidylglycerophosphatase A
VAKIALFLASMGGVGKAPVAPGTFGSVLAVFLFFLIRTLSPLHQILCTTAVLLLGLWAATVVENQWKRHDDSRIVIDEWVGMWISLVALPLSPGWWISAFLLFRLLDILKPFPAGWIDHMWPKGWGVMFDDVASGIYVFLILHTLRLWLGAM